MSIQNQLSRYGAISRTTPDLAPGSKLFLVCDSDDTTVGPINLGAMYPVDGDGVVRVYTTIQAAVNATSAGRGDVVAVLPGFDYTLAGADSWNKAGVNVIGLGAGNSRPIIRYTAIGSTIDVGANNVHIKNLTFLADADSVARGLDLDSGFSGAVVENCVFDYDTNTSNFTTMLRVAQGNSVIQDNEFLAEDTAGCGKGVEILGGYSDFLKVRRNFFYGQFDTVGDTTNNAAAIAIAVVHDSGDTILSGVEIAENTIVSTDTAAAVLINLDPTALGAPRGVVRDNRFVSYDTATADTAQVNFGTTGGFLPIGNLFVDGDSDVPEEIVGRQAKLVGLQDS
jgi:hypothetical protein